MRRLRLYILAAITLALLLVAPLRAATFYVRGLSGEYGLEDGTSYANAFDGFLDIPWGVGAGLVGPDDILYICDTWQYPTDFPAESGGTGGIFAGTFGTLGHLVQIRGDLADHPGVIVNARAISTAGWTDLGNGSFSRSATFSSTRAWEGPNTYDGARLLWLVGSAANCAALDGSTYLDDPGNTVYYNPIGDSIVNTLYIGIPGPGFDFGGQDYVGLYGLTVWGGGSNDGNIRLAKSGKGDSDITGYVVDSCNLHIAQYTAIYRGGYNGINGTITNNRITRSHTGTYFLHNGGKSETGLTMSGNEADGKEDVADYLSGSSDRHAFGGQDIRDSTFDNNYVHDWPGDGFINYLGDTSDGTDVIVRRNRFINIDDVDENNYHYGIAITGSNASNMLTRTAGCVISQNIIMNCMPGSVAASAGGGAGIRLKGNYGGTVLNNAIYNCVSNIQWEQGGTGFGGMAGTVKNNLFIYPTEYHVWMDNDQPGGVDATVFDNNIWFPDTTGAEYLWRYRSTGNLANFAAWQASPRLKDLNGESADPLISVFPPTIPSDFYPASGASPLVNNGVDVGLVTDWDGNPVPGPGNATPDVGPLEYQSPRPAEISVCAAYMDDPSCADIASGIILTFGPIDEGATGDYWDFDVANIGDDDLIFVAVTVPTGFILTTDLPGTIDGGTTETMRVTLDTSVAGLYGGAIEIDSSDEDENPFIINLNGTVTALVPEPVIFEQRVRFRN